MNSIVKVAGTRVTPLKFLWTLGTFFVVLKLFGHLAAWSWWYVTLPFWILPSILLTFIGVGLGMVFLIIVALIVLMIFGSK